MIGWFLSVTGLGRVWAYAAAALAVVGAVGLVLLRVRAGGRAAERADRAIETGRIKHEQIKAGASAPRGTRAVAGSLRDGSF